MGDTLSQVFTKLGLNYAEFTPGEQSCISNKISKLRDAGTKETQAIAEAINVCAPTKSKSSAFSGGHYLWSKNSDGTYNLFDIPVFAKHTRKLGMKLVAGKDGQPEVQEQIVRVDEKWLSNAISRNRERFKAGYLGALHVRHHPNDPSATDTTEAAGHFVLKYVKNGFYDGQFIPLLYADFIKVPSKIFERMKLGLLPYRSIESLPPNYDEIDSIALLDTETPWFRFAMTIPGEEIQRQVYAAVAPPFMAPGLRGWVSSGRRWAALSYFAPGTFSEKGMKFGADGAPDFVDTTVKAEAEAEAEGGMGYEAEAEAEAKMRMEAEAEAEAEAKMTHDFCGDCKYPHSSGKHGKYCGSCKYVHPEGRHKMIYCGSCKGHHSAGKHSFRMEAAAEKDTTVSDGKGKMSGKPREDEIGEEDLEKPEEEDPDLGMAKAAKKEDSENCPFCDQFHPDDGRHDIEDGDSEDVAGAKVGADKMPKILDTLTLIAKGQESLLAAIQKIGQLGAPPAAAAGAPVSETGARPSSIQSKAGEEGAARVTALEALVFGMKDEKELEIKVEALISELSIKYNLGPGAKEKLLAKAKASKDPVSTLAVYKATIEEHGTQMPTNYSPGNPLTDTTGKPRGAFIPPPGEKIPEEIREFMSDPETAEKALKAAAVFKDCRELGSIPGSMTLKEFVTYRVRPGYAFKG